MAKLTLAQRSAVDNAIYHLDRAQKFLSRPDIAVAVYREQTTTTLDYTRADGKVLCTIAKDIGSDLCGLEDARRNLARLGGV